MGLKIIQLGDKVLVGDPFDVANNRPIEKIDNILPGKYHSYVDTNGRITSLVVFHEKFLSNPKKIRRMQWNYISDKIGKTSGKYGIFHVPLNINIGDTATSDENDHIFKQEWLNKVYDATNSVEGWGVYENSVIVSTYFSYDEYRLHVHEENQTITAIKMQFDHLGPVPIDYSPY
jgi:hypothetical protein